jgi:phage/plasmid-associated DNA primase
MLGINQQLNIEPINNSIDNISYNYFAKKLMEKYGYKYRCASIRFNIWFEFKNHKWIETDSSYCVRYLIDELIIDYNKQQTQLYHYANQCYDDDTKIQCYEKAKIIFVIINKLSSNAFKNNIIRAYAELAYDPNFLKNLDENINLICFTNGVYNLTTNEFRDGKPDDYISLCTNYEYIEYDKNNKYSGCIKRFFQMIQPDKTMRKYLLTVLSTCLFGSAPENIYVFLGSGSNGKNKVMELMKYVLGDLFKPMDIMILINKISELADKKGIRICMFDDFGGTNEINANFIKIFLNDNIKTRSLYKDPIYFRSHIKSFFLSDHMPNIELKCDDLEKIKIIDFPSKFVNHFNVKLKPNQFRVNANLSCELFKWKQMFMAKLIKYYNKYRANGLIHPDSVKQNILNYYTKQKINQILL